MKNLIPQIFLLALLLFSMGSLHAQPVDFLWTVQVEGDGFFDDGRDIATDAAGNIILAGQFEGSATFGDTTLSSFGSADIYLAKYDADGNVLWATQAGGNNFDEGIAVAVDEAGNIFLSGHFVETASFEDTSLTSLGFQDIFLAKYDAAGNLHWVKQAGGTETDIGIDMAVDNSGNVALCGFFSGSSTFDNTTLTSVGFEDVFVARFDSNGNVLWAVQGGGDGTDNCFGLTTDSANNVIISGVFAETASFGSTSLTSVGFVDIFVAKYDSDGNVLWAKQAGGADFDSGSGVAADASGNIVVTGTFGSFGPPTGGSASFGNITLNSAGLGDIFVAKYDSDGNVLWAKQAGSSSFDSGQDIATDNAGNIVVTGGFNEQATFGDTTMVSNGFLDVFIAKYDSDGNVLWVKQGGGSDFDTGISIATNSAGDILTTGSFNGTANFDNTTLTSGGGQDIFIVKIAGGLTGIDDALNQPRLFTLAQNYPNPFNPSTTIEFTLEKSSLVQLTVYNVSGQAVATLVSDRLAAGSYQYKWDASNLSSGVYFYRIDVEQQSLVKRAILLK